MPTTITTTAKTTKKQKRAAEMKRTKKREAQSRARARDARAERRPHNPRADDFDRSRAAGAKVVVAVAEGLTLAPKRERNTKVTAKKPARRRRRDKPEHMVWWKTEGDDRVERILDLPPRAEIARDPMQPLGINETSATAVQWLHLMECHRARWDADPPASVAEPPGYGPRPVSVCCVALAFLSHWARAFESDVMRTQTIGPLLGHLLDTRATEWMQSQRAIKIFAWYLDEHLPLLLRAINGGHPASFPPLSTLRAYVPIHAAIDDARKSLAEAEASGVETTFFRACRALEQPIADAAFFARLEIARADPPLTGEPHVPWALLAVEDCLRSANLTGPVLGPLLRDLRWFDMGAARLASRDPGYALATQQIRTSAVAMLQDLYDPIPF